MKQATLIFLLLGAILALVAQTSAWEWAVSGGGTVNDYCSEICADPAGNSYTTGSFQGTAYFGSFTITSAGTQDVFVAKTDNAGNYVWVVRGGGADGDQGWAIARDSSGNIFVSGYFAGTATFGTHSVTSVGQFDMFVAKLDPDGNWLWAVSGGSVYYDHSYGVSTDGAGNCYATGYFNGTATFGPFTLTGPAFWGSIWVAKLDPAGNWLWAVSGGGPSTDGSESIATDSAGYSCITGYFEGTSTFGTHSVTSFGNNDILVAKLDPDGNWLWASNAGGSFPEGGRSVAVDSDGKCYITGSFSSENAAFGTQIIHGDGWDYEVFAACLDGDGNWLWANGTTPLDYDDDSGEDIIPDGYGNCYITGSINGTAIFGTTTLTSYGLSDIFVAKLDNTGNWVWAMQAGSASSSFGDAGTAIAIASDTHVLVSGSCSVNCVFGSITLTNYPMYANAFVASLYDEVQNPVPGPVTLLSPENGAMNLPLAGFDLTWEPDPNFGTPDHYEIYLADSPDQIYFQQFWICDENHTNPVEEGMAFGTDETWYWTVVAVNDAGSTPTSEIFSFTTWSQWVVETLPATWDFEGPAFPPDGWTSEDLDGVWSYWELNVDNNHTPGGSQSALHWRSDLEPSQNGWLVTPPVAVPAGQYTELSFWHNSWWEDFYDYSGVLVNTTNDPNDPDWVELWSPQRVGQFWLQDFVNVSVWGGQVVYFAFVYRGLNATDWFVDDVSVCTVAPVTEFPAVWDFEDGVFPPVGWTKADLDCKETTWILNGDNNHTPAGQYSAAHFYSTLWDEDPGQDGWLITPPVAVPADGIWGLYFWDRIFWFDYYRHNGVLVNTTNDPHDTGWVEIWSPSYQNEEWAQEIVNINAYRGQTVYFAFRYEGYDGHDWYLDDISIQNLGADSQPPIISYLKPLNSPRDDIPFRFTATVVDDPTFQSPIGGMALHCSYYGSEGFVTLPMALLSGNTWFADIPPQPLDTEVDYYFEAWDIYGNYADTQPYKWFYVDDPTWLSYDDGGTNHLGFDDQNFGVAAIYENPFFDLNQPVRILQTGCGADIAATAELHVYSYDGTNLLDAMAPLAVNLNEGEWITYQDLAAFNVDVETQYFVVAYENIPAGTHIWFDSRYDYGMCRLITGNVLEAMPATGSWVIPTYVTRAGLAAPQISITPVDWYFMISWEPVPGAAGYNFYGSSDPYSGDWTLLQTTADTWCFYQEPEPQQFFRVTALSELPLKNPAERALQPYLPNGPLRDFKARRPARLSLDK